MPLHFFDGLPVEENISPEYSLWAASPQFGQATPSENFLTNSSNSLPHLGQRYCKTGIYFLFLFLFCFFAFGRAAALALSRINAIIAVTVSAQEITTQNQTVEVSPLNA